MKKIAAILFLLTISAYSFAAPFSDPNKTKITITVTTSDIGEIVKEIGGNKVDVFIMIKPILCPSNYDITPAIVTRTEKSNLVLSHKWETWISRLKLQAGDRGILYKTVKTEGNWMIPYINVRAAEEIKNMLVYMDSDNSKYYDANFTDYIFRVNFAASEVRKQLENAYGKKVIANEKIKDFLEWAGFEVIATYGKETDLTAKRMAYLVSEGKKQGVKIVVDNIQAGAGTGRELAENIGAKREVVSNFPIGESYINTLVDNGNRLYKVMR